MADTTSLSEAKRKVLGLLKRLGPATAQDIASRAGTTDVAARQHLGALEEAGLVRPSPRPPAGRGRPSVEWSLTDRAGALFPDHHAELAVGLIDAIRVSGGEAGLMRIVEVRARDQVNLYRRLAGAGASLKQRVEALAEQRTAEGYMAEVVPESPGCYLLIEHHCPICDAARACTGLCRAELEVFRETLGDDVEVERTKHLLTDDDRCVYRVRQR
ncbi:MAG: transcriptional regulator [Planctomycetes bacterium]|nr:transcriptional regulator [Planctomycetota bacterium]